MSDISWRTCAFILAVGVVALFRKFSKREKPREHGDEQTPTPPASPN